MSSPAGAAMVADLLRVPGRLSLAPTSLTAAFPGAGGTDLGKFIDAYLEPRHGYSIIQEEAGGKAIQDAVDLGESLVMGFLLQDLNSTMLAKAFADTTTGASGQVLVRYPGSFSPGTLLSAKAARLVFWPNDEERHNFVVMWRALFFLEESARLAHRLDQDLGTPLLAIATLGTKADNVTERAYEWGLRRDITL